jgi:NADH dehydrogenase
VERREARGGTLILGGGFAGSYVARLLKRRGATIVSLENFMLYTPLLPEAASGTLEPRHVVVPLREMCPHAELVLGRITGHDRESRVVTVGSLAGELEIGYERLVVALGATTRTFPVPGLLEHGVGFKDLADAIALRNSVLLQLERASIHPDDPAELGFVFVGAGYAGVEALAELHDMTQAALRSYPELRQVSQRWVLVDAAAKILPEIPRRLGEYASRRLTKRGIEIHVGTTLESYDGTEAVLANGTHVPARTLVWTAGVRANPLLAQLDLPLDERGRVVVDEFLRVDGSDHVWSLGDCAAVPNCRTPGEADPPTCQHALRQARRLAKNLTGEPQPYGYRMLGQVATLGRFKGIAEIPGLHLWGFPGWFVTRTYHLYQLPLLTRKLRVVVDWTVALFFRRDIVELSMIGHPHKLERES